MNRLRHGLVAAVSALSLLLLIPAAAPAATIETVPAAFGNELRYAAAPGEVNQPESVTINGAGEWEVVEGTAESTATLTAGAGCTSITPKIVRCARDSSDYSLSIDLGDMTDYLRSGPWFDADSAVFFGSVAFYTQTISGGDGDDWLTDQRNIETIDGGPGDDTIFAGDCLRPVGDFRPADVFVGGGGDADHVQYSCAPAAVQVSIDDVANDGIAGETDNVRNGVEIVTGTAFDDTLTAAEEAQLRGGNGNDYLEGSDYDQYLRGGNGDDTLIGHAGADTLDPGSGSDYADGGLGFDQFHDEPEIGADTYIGGPLSDTYIGGDWHDLLYYVTENTGVRVSLDDVANDGQPGEGDQVLAMEDVHGSDYADVLVGNENDNGLLGGPGDDDLSGLGGDDYLAGDGFLGDEEPGSDTMDGGSGADEFQGGPGFDTVSYADRTAPVSVTLDALANDGEAGEGDYVAPDGHYFVDPVGWTTESDNERIVFGSGNDTINGIGTGMNGRIFELAAGDDLAHDALGTLNTINCGPGTDDATDTDPGDTLTACEDAAPPNPPVITDVTPPEGNPGDPVDVIGRDFCPDDDPNVAENEVTFDGIQATVLSESTTRIGVITPVAFSPGQQVQVLVDCNGMPSNPEPWKVVSQRPIANAVAEIDQDNGMRFTFDGSASFDPDGGQIQEYQWRYKGEQISARRAFHHTFGAKGKKTLRLTVIDDEGERDSTTVSVRPNKPTKSAVIVPGILFDFDSAHLRRPAKRKLRLLRSYIEQARKIKVSGYASDERQMNFPRVSKSIERKTEKHNLRLSDRRAHSVVRFLLKKTPKAQRPARVKSKGYGESHKFKRLTKNRRVEIVIWGSFGVPSSE